MLDYYATPHSGVLPKQIDHLNDYARRLIALSLFVVLGIQGIRGSRMFAQEGRPGISPSGER